MPKKIYISVSKLQKPDIGEVLRLAYYADKKSLSAAFKEYKIDIKSEEDLLFIKELHDSGADMHGAVRNGDGERIVLSVADVLIGVKINKDSLKKSNIQFVA